MLAPFLLIGGKKMRSKEETEKWWHSSEGATMLNKIMTNYSGMDIGHTTLNNLEFQIPNDIDKCCLAQIICEDGCTTEYVKTADGTDDIIVSIN